MSTSEGGEGYSVSGEAGDGGGSVCVCVLASLRPDTVTLAKYKRNVSQEGR